MLKKLTIMMVASTIALSSAYAGKVIRIAHDAKPDAFDNVAHGFSATFKSIVESRSNGSIKVEIFPANQLGNSNERLAQTREGLIQGTIASTGSLATVYPPIDLLNLPFAFKTMSAAYDVYDGKFGKALTKDIDKSLKDIKVMGIVDTGGFFAITNSKRPIKTVADFKGIRIRTMTVPAHQKLINSIGGEAYPLAWSELYSGLQTGVVDGQMNPIPNIKFARFDEVQKYMTLTNHLYAPIFFMMNNDFVSSLTKEEQAIIKDAVNQGIIVSRGLGRLNTLTERGLASLAKNMEVNSLTPDALKEFKTKAQAGVKQHFADSLDANGKSLLKILEAEANKANSKY